MTWLRTLVSEYKHQIDTERGRFIKRAFNGKSDTVMNQAVSAFVMGENEWFTVGGLNKEVERAERFTDDSVTGTVDMLDHGPTEDEARATLAEWGRCDECGGQQNSLGECPRCWSLNVVAA